MAVQVFDGLNVRVDVHRVIRTEPGQRDHSAGELDALSDDSRTGHAGFVFVAVKLEDAGVRLVHLPPQVSQSQLRLST
jgi:hypothetical protein